MGYSIQRNGFLTFKTMVNAFIGDLKDHGFTLIHPQTFSVAPSSLTTAATLEAGNSVDPLHAGQAWRLRIEAVSDNRVNLYAGTSFQLDNAGIVAPSNANASEKQGQLFASQASSGFMGDPEWSLPGSSPLIGSGSSITGTSLPLAYQLSISGHGVAACFWSEGSDEFGKRFSWFVIQRPVHPTTGEVLVTGKCPVFCIYSCGGGGGSRISPYLTLNRTGINKFVVREADVNTPSTSVSAVAYTADSNAIMNSLTQTSFTEDGKYIIIFPSGLNTNRYQYIHEIDMIAYTSADVIPPQAIIRLPMYGETDYPPGVAVPTDPCAPLYTREYIALLANSPWNTGMRLLMLINGGSVTKV